MHNLRRKIGKAYYYGSRYQLSLKKRSELNEDPLFLYLYYLSTNDIYRDAMGAFG